MKIVCRYGVAKKEYEIPDDQWPSDFEAQWRRGVAAYCGSQNWTGQIDGEATLTDTGLKAFIPGDRYFFVDFNIGGPW